MRRYKSKVKSPKLDVDGKRNKSKKHKDKNAH